MKYIALLLLFLITFSAGCVKKEAKTFAIIETNMGTIEEK